MSGCATTDRYAIDARTLAFVEPSGWSDVLIPLKHFHTSTDVEELGDEVRRFLQGQDRSSPLHQVLWLVVAESVSTSASR